MKIFDAETSCLIAQYQIFGGQSLHGIVVKNTDLKHDNVQVIIWGGYDVLILTKNELERLLDGESSFGATRRSRTPDWILDVAISPFQDNAAVLVTANNTVLHAIIDPASESITITELSSPSKSILYSSHLVWDTPGEILIAAGTVFGEIIAWSCKIEVDISHSSSTLLHTFTGHEGSIFGVAISPVLRLSDRASGRLLVSCSDDRTVRVWDLAAVTPQAAVVHLVTRETGFGDNGIGVADHCVAVAMGHSSRIWRVRFLVEDDPVSSIINILSFGEDSTTQQWSLSLQPKQDLNETITVGRLAHEKSYAYHNGKHIWSTALHPKGGPFNVLATGGADGKISQYLVSCISTDNLFGNDHPDNSHSPSQRISENQIDWDVSDVLTALGVFEPEDITEDSKGPRMDAATIDKDLDLVSEAKPKKKKKPKKIPKDAFNRYAFVSDDKAIMTTNFGRVLLLNLRQDRSWTQLKLPESSKDDLRSWSVVKGLPDSGIALLAGANGIIWAYTGVDTLREVGKVDGKVADMFIVTKHDTRQCSLIVTNLQGTSFSYFDIRSTISTVALDSPVEYTLPSAFIVTSAAHVGDLLVLGSRYGQLAIFDALGQHIELGDATRLPTPDAITCILPVPNSNQEDSHRYFLATARDGSYYVYHLSPFTTDSSDTATLCSILLVHQGSPPFGPMIEQAWYSPSGDLLLYGFKSKNFVVWNESQQHEIMNIDCGGAHRSYAFQPSKTGGNFLFTKASRLCLSSQSEPSHQIVKHGGHGREIKSCAVSGDEKYFATAAEDTSIRIWSYTEGSKPTDNRFHCHAMVQRHTTGVQHLQWYKSKYLFSSGGYEEFFIWAITPLPNNGIGIMCEAITPFESEDKDLRVMNFDVTAIPGNDNEKDEKLLISLAYSDSTIRVYSYSKDNGYKAVAKARYTSSCLTQIQCLQISNEKFCLLTAATDGNLVTWYGALDTSSTHELVIRTSTKVHQNSIKCLDVAYTTSKTHAIIATGGDDNGLSISIYSTSKLLDAADDNSRSQNHPKIFTLKSAHAAAVTGLVFVTSPNHLPRPSSQLQNPGKEIHRIISSSNDQRVKEWMIGISVDEEIDVRIEKTGDVFTPVADVGDVACLRSGQGTTEKGNENESEIEDEDKKAKVLIVGNGMEVWNVGCVMGGS